jgi:hypothetical protein
MRGTGGPVASPTSESPDVAYPAASSAASPFAAASVPTAVPAALPAAGAAVPAAASEVRTDGYCSPRQRTHLGPSCLVLTSIL